MNNRLAQTVIILFLSSLLVIDSALAQQETFGGTGNPNTVRNLVRDAIQSKNLPYTPPTQPLVRADGTSDLWTNNGTDRDDRAIFHQPTLNKVCEILGYNTYVSSTCRDQERSGRYPRGKCNFHSPSNNHLSRFTGNGFSQENATPKRRKTWIATITCKDPIHTNPPQECTPYTDKRYHPNQVACWTGLGGSCEAGWLKQTCGHDGKWPPHNANESHPNVECVPKNNQYNCNQGPSHCTPTLDYDAHPPISMTSEYWTYCSDGIDNDCDGAVDCEDSDCPACSGHNPGPGPHPTPPHPTPTPVYGECAVNLTGEKRDLETALNRVSDTSVTALNTALTPVQQELNAGAHGYNRRALQRAVKNINRSLNKTNTTVDAGVNLIRSIPGNADICVENCRVRDLLEDAENISVKAYLLWKRTRAGIRKSSKGLTKRGGNRYTIPSSLRTQRSNVRNALDALEETIDELPDEICK